MNKERRIGIMGGTFNPVHYAQLLLAESAREQFSLDRVIFIPSGFPYMKVILLTLLFALSFEPVGIVIIPESRLSYPKYAIYLPSPISYTQFRYGSITPS